MPLENRNEMARRKMTMASVYERKVVNNNNKNSSSSLSGLINVN